MSKPLSTEELDRMEREIMQNGFLPTRHGIEALIAQARREISLRTELEEARNVIKETVVDHCASRRLKEKARAWLAKHGKE